jgi:6-pyruvoyl-tetrahydropterin synthase
VEPHTVEERIREVDNDQSSRSEIRFDVARAWLKKTIQQVQSKLDHRLLRYVETFEANPTLEFYAKRISD